MSIEPNFEIVIYYSDGGTAEHEEETLDAAIAYAKEHSLADLVEGVQLSLTDVSLAYYRNGAEQ